MTHLQPFKAREILSLPIAESAGWQIKRYGLLAKQKQFNESVVAAALPAAIERLPTAGHLSYAESNHGVGFQIVHFAEVAVVSPIFYWLWGSVLANTQQMRAQWDSPNEFQTGAKHIIGCVWEMQLVCFETQAWQQTMLNDEHTPEERLKHYLNKKHPSAIVSS